MKWLYNLVVKDFEIVEEQYCEIYNGDTGVTDRVFLTNLIYQIKNG